MNPCMVIKGKKVCDNKFRPGTHTPDLHWAYRIMDKFIKHDGSGRQDHPTHIQIDYGQDDSISLTITEDLWKEDEVGFIELMKFIKDNDLTYEFPSNMEACGACDGHPDCVSQCHIIHFDEEH